MDYIEWFLVEDVDDWEGMGGDAANIPDEFPVMAANYDGVLFTVNYDTASILVNYFEDNPHVEFELEDGNSGGLH